ncbi:MAG TPA: hypothetical protein VFU49_06960, partial [Ktedonobacteraceae bacterium]|nr:hypothetical protein [Ktedonobacteraceae bacterium]
MPMFFPYERYETLAEPLTVYYPTGEEKRARWVLQTVEKAGKQLSGLLDRSMPAMELLLVSEEDWPLVPHDETEDVSKLHPYWTDVTDPPS